MEHHWIDNTNLVDEGDPSFVCKHCPAVGEYHSIIEGREVDDDDERIVEVPGR